jgi:hypothetical protein
MSCTSTPSLAIENRSFQGAVIRPHTAAPVPDAIDHSQGLLSDNYMLTIPEFMLRKELPLLVV